MKMIIVAMFAILTLSGCGQLEKMAEWYYGVEDVDWVANNYLDQEDQLIITAVVGREVNPRFYDDQEAATALAGCTRHGFTAARKLSAKIHRCVVPDGKGSCTLYRAEKIYQCHGGAE